VILKSYFDGGNQADSTQYDVVTLAMLSGTLDQWRPLESAWRDVLKNHGADWLHTTDAVALSDPYSRRKDWDDARRDSFINDCVSAIEPLIVRKKRVTEPPRFGVYPCTISVVLSDYIKARQTLPNTPADATEICSTQALHRFLEWGTELAHADFYHLVFDQNEPFRGHIEDRRRNKKAKKEFPILGRIMSATDADMRHVPALQVADLFAWCVSHKNKQPYFSWQKRLLDLDRMDDWISSEHLANPITRTLELAKEWKLPPRKPTR
jgi:hypothetical protein